MVEQELPSLWSTWDHPRFFVGVCINRSLVLFVCFEDWCLSFYPFSFGHCVVCPSIYGLWLPLWFLQTLLLIIFCICALVPCVSNIFVRVCTSWRRGLSCSLCNLDKYIITWVLIKLSNDSIFSSVLAAMLVEFRLLLRVCFINLNWFFF